MIELTIKSDEAFGILMKTDGRGALENPIIMGAEGARGVLDTDRYSLNLSGKRTERHIFCAYKSIFFKAAVSAALFYFYRRLYGSYSKFSPSYSCMDK